MDEEPEPSIVLGGESASAKLARLTFPRPQDDDDAAISAAEGLFSVNLDLHLEWKDF